ncbi:D-threonate 4-phosphate dehydrogenase [Caprobacter fermentans]|uniref:4-hydroxythreonine-4-phosphate dehydrogenase PdxA n=1 Tax=Caproicibacter fermentans TaxID=2576756 RepID=A0A6N8I2W3_9FIRM|nr:4-hydroxythreonine-4-phosphate dehydrogenase PdxA [Caproicibacter fermentans]MVB12481.1 D-threonate 4-phosphate dehydrogenase [Caproicibacter fermentans]OCN01502.1 4-hydroxythreonine-4-phosphate dehydrogenase PdxA [Clostridium sp. W14A]QNK40569.1 4-hydroxythreonine-4-phosphate dehydrogenase PdxA [Caproicibacter fermentans]
MNRFGITLGDPCGIGPEITLKALRAHPEYLDRCVVFGSAELLCHYGRLLGCGFPIRTVERPFDCGDGCLNVVDPNPVSLEEIPVGRVSPVGGRCAFLAVRAAIDAALKKEISLIVTAPLNKEALHLAGYPYAGHTEIFGEFAHGDSYAMLLWSEKLKVIHVSTHVSLRKACDACRKERETEVIRLADRTLKKAGYEKPRIAVAGLNPHAGENGIFGDEEIVEIAPAVELCRADGVDVVGPLPPDTVFLRALNCEYDVVVAQYHDQGHIPLKLLDFDGGVNITVGLDVLRTSVDHGTAFDIAGKLVAREDSMLKAIEIGEKLHH